MVDSQSVQGADTVARSSRGYDAGKKINGRKRHIAVDTNGLLLAVVVTMAGIQDRDGAIRLLAALRARFSTISLVWADGGYAGRLIDWSKRVVSLTVQVVKRTDDVKGFKVLPRRWVVERTFAWICKHRRCVRDYETRPDHHEAMVYIAMIATMSRRLARTA
ncbi:IS5 family transposase [Rhodococcus qingshengii]|nr:IS5 family transposase [Rhodococcus qingshengii]MEA1797598.1 IS5 family transposase [Rhodococcus qingshengii]